MSANGRFSKAGESRGYIAARLAWLLRFMFGDGLYKGFHLRTLEAQMLADLLSYGLLVSVFVVTGLRMFVEKPNKLVEVPSFRRKRSPRPKR